MGDFINQMLFVYFSPYRKQSLLAFLCILIVIAFDTLFPLGTKFMIDLAITPHNLRTFVILVAGLVGLYLISSAGSLGLDYLKAWLVARVLRDIRLKMFAHLQTLPASYYSKTESGDILTRFTTDLTAIEYALTNSFIIGALAVMQLLVSVGVLFALDVKLGTLTILILPLTIVLPRSRITPASRLVSQRRAEEAGITGAIQENLQAQAVNRVFGLRDRAIAAFSLRINHFAEICTRSAFAGWIVNRTTELGQYLVQLLVVSVGAYLVLINQLSVGSWVGFTSLLIGVGHAISLVSKAYSGLIPGAASLERIENLLNEKITMDDHPDVPLPRLSIEIAFDQVTFRYTGEAIRPDLSQVNFSIQRGNSVALIGRSGSGKSTLLNLLIRLYDPQAGCILIDGRNIREVSLASLRGQMGVVFQDTFLFNISLRENIRLGKPDASDAEVEEAARAAGIHETILRLPQGYDTLAGEQGRALSGGQRQRIAIARAILRHPAILLLDEVTSALDPETEMRIYDTLKQLSGTCTILSVTHRLAPVAYMDQIVAVDQGQIVEIGSHAELMQRQGLYYQMFTQQSGFTVSADGLDAEVTPARLRGIPLFEKLDDFALEKLAPLFVAERYEAGRVVIQEGDPGDKFYIIVRGEVSFTVSGGSPTPKQMEDKQDGDYFGEIALLERRPRTATVRTILPTLFLTLERKHFLNMLDSYPAVRAAVEETARMRLNA